MTDLFGNRARETYTYRRVTWDWIWDVAAPEVPHAGPRHFHEAEDYGNVVSGSVELSAFSDLKGSCSFDFLGGDAPTPDDLVRIYYSFIDDDGERVEYPIGTFFVEYAKVKRTADYSYGAETTLNVSGTCEGYSVLKVLADAVYGMPYTIAAGEQPVQKAVGIMEGLGLRVNVRDTTTYQLSTDYTFEPDASYLSIVNWCMSAAGFAAVTPSPTGDVVVQRYIDPSKRAVGFTFANDDNSIMYPEVEEENDWQQTPNAVRLYYGTEEVSIYAYARNKYGSKASLGNRGGRELTTYESISELQGATSAQMLANLKSAALKKLLDNSSEIERVSLSHPYVPIFQNDAIAINYAGKSWQGNITNMKISLAPATKCTTEIRRFISNDLTTDQGGAVIWEVSS